MSTPHLEKATLTHLGTLESIAVGWNPERYSVSRRASFAAPAVIGATLSPLQHAAGGIEEFVTDLLLDSTREPEGARDLRPTADRIAQWMESVGDSGLPERCLFSWGSFRFRGAIAAMDELWVRFDPDGTPVRGWLRLTLRR